MYSKLKGKKLLVIGSDASNNNIISAAHEMGVYTIVTDGIADRSRTPAKNISDEAWDIDYSDIKTLSEKCREAGVNGVFAGYSEFRVLAACRLYELASSIAAAELPDECTAADEAEAEESTADTEDTEIAETDEITEIEE